MATSKNASKATTVAPGDVGTPDPIPATRRAKKATPPRRCSLRLVIAGVEYRVRPVAVEGSPRAFTLTRDGAEPYTAAARPSGPTCSCDAFQYRKAGSTCKHVAALVALGIL